MYVEMCVFEGQGGRRRGREGEGEGGREEEGREGGRLVRGRYSLNQFHPTSRAREGGTAISVWASSRTAMSH